MYLFEHVQRAHLYHWPYPHLVIHTALDPELAQQLTDQLDCENPSPLWKEVIEENVNQRSTETVRYLDSVFGLSTPAFRVHEANFAALSFDHEPRLERDWHLDSSMKKYQTLYFLGKCTKGGEHEMLEESTGMKKVIPHTHNMMLAWHNNHNEPRAMHRFYTGQGQRFTFNMPVDSVDDDHEH